MFCKECGNQIKENGKFCSKCGTPVEPVEAIQESVFNNAEQSMDNTEESGSRGNAFKNILTKNKLPIIIGAAVVLLLIVGIASAARISNLFHKTFSSPESYYQFVEKKAMKDTYDIGGDLYNSFILESLNTDKSVSGEISVELEEEGEELLELVGPVGVDLSWLKSIQAEGNFSIKDNIFNVELGTSLNNKRIVSGNVIMDVENEEVFIQIPELTQTYMGIYLEDVLSSYELRQLEEFQDVQEMSKDLERALPSEDQVEKLFKKYINIALECVDDVSVGSETLEVEGIEKKYTELEITFDSDTIEDMMEAVLKEMAEDKDIEEYIINVAEAAGEDGDDAYEEFVDGIDHTLNYLIVDDDFKIVMKVYVDGKGEIKGRIIEWRDYWGDKQSIRMLMPQKGNKVGFELSMKTGSDKVVLSGSGKKSGNKVTGEYELRYNGVPVLDITTKKLNAADLKKGRMNGEIGIKLSSKIKNLLNFGYSGYDSTIESYILSGIADLEFKINASCSKNSSEYTIEIIHDEEDIVAITTSVKVGKGSETSIPSQKNTVMIEDFDDILDWLEEIDWDKVLDNLEKTDLPDDILDYFEDIADELE